ncbi:MAG TPA: ABC transporter ATP-binding protein [Candidatus Nanopelagicaceae bacterium]|nr:ABC transporter ATP-binding protein [Candidatus Nanopelagicaceae bacterium]
MENEFIEKAPEIEDIAVLREIKEGNILILANNLVKDYEIGDFIVRAVDDLSIRIKESAFVIIKGPSGAGKTTLLNLIGGLDTPNSGSIYFDGVKITNLKEESLATFRLINTGFIFQNYNLISTLTAEENIMFPMKLAGMSLKEQRERALNLLKKVGLGDRREHLPFQLSAGEQQRVAIARALANDPPIIIADEPTANLDKTTSLFIRDLFNDMKQEGKTIIIATHDEYLIKLADRVITFEDGKIVNEQLVNLQVKN